MPRDFFLHLGAFATLYSAVVALATLLFRMVDYTFPDPLRDAYYYSDPYSGPMRFAIASLIILVPICLYLIRIIQREAREAPERYSLGIRRWLTYITLFAAGATIIGDLIALLNSFLGGTLAIPFVLKVLALLVIVGIIFWYFLLDIHGYWQHKESTSKAVGFGVLGLVVVVVVAGFFIMGSPSVQREIRLDQQQVQDLSMLQQQIIQYWQQNGRLPTALSELENSLLGYSLPSAPEGREPYEYRVTGDLTFSLCATFARSSSEYSSAEPYAYNPRSPGSDRWEHQPGRICFDRTIDPDLIQPLPLSQPPVMRL